MFHRILVPLDGSATAESAVPIAARLAHAAGSTVVLLRVVAPPLPQALFLVGKEQGIRPADPQQIPKEVEDYLTRVAARPEFSGVSVEILLLSGRPAPSILQIAEEHMVDLVIISRHGQSALSRWQLGSVAQHIARQSPVPVLVLRETESTTEGATSESLLATASRPPRVLVTLDGSKVAEAVLDPAADLSVALAHPAPAMLHLLLVVEHEFGDVLAEVDDARTAMLMKGAQGYLTRVAKQVEQTRGATVQLSSEVVVTAIESGNTAVDVAETILRVAQHGEETDGGNSAGYDVISMASHGFTGLTHWMLGSVTERVLQGAKVPVLVVRPRQISEEASSLAKGDA